MNPNPNRINLFQTSFLNIPGFNPTSSLDPEDTRENFFNALGSLSFDQLATHPDYQGEEIEFFIEKEKTLLRINNKCKLLREKMRNLNDPNNFQNSIKHFRLSNQYVIEVYQLIKEFADNTNFSTEKITTAYNKAAEIGVEALNREIRLDSSLNKKNIVNLTSVLHEQDRVYQNIEEIDELVHPENEYLDLGKKRSRR